MARGGVRPGAGRPKGLKNALPKTRCNPEKSQPAPDIVRAAINAGLTPLEYMLQVMRDPGADQARRDRMAMAAAPILPSAAWPRAQR